MIEIYMPYNPNLLTLDRREGLIDPSQLGIGAVALSQTVEFNPGTVELYPGTSERGLLTHARPGFIERHRDFWKTVPRGKDAFVDCSDDRVLTPESIAQLMTYAREGMMSPLEGTASIFGGLSGAVVAVLQAGTATYGPNFINAVGGFYGVARQLIDQGDGSFAQHTAEGAEGNPAAFDPNSEEAIACAYNEAIGIVASVLSKRPGAGEEDSHIQAVAKRDQTVIFGRNDLAVEALFEATYYVAEHFAELAQLQTGMRGATAEDFKVGRQVYIDLQREKAPTSEVSVPIEVLAGKHLPCSKTGVISNFNINQVGRAGKFYRLGVGRVADEIMRATRDMNIPAELLVRAIQMDSVPPRAVLYAHDAENGGHGPLDPEGLPMGSIGKPWETIRILDARWST